MDSLLLLIRNHGYSVAALLVFLEAIGLPVPAALALLAAGAASAAGILNPGWLLAAVVPATMAGDLLLYTLGRYTAGPCWDYSVESPPIPRLASCVPLNRSISVDA